MGLEFELALFTAFSGFQIIIKNLHEEAVLMMAEGVGLLGLSLPSPFQGQLRACALRCSKSLPAILSNPAVLYTSWVRTPHH